jgi:hypothetical protein
VNEAKRHVLHIHGTQETLTSVVDTIGNPLLYFRIEIRSYTGRRTDKTMAMTYKSWIIRGSSGVVEVVETIASNITSVG